ncbi:MAG: dephospho-CoA kinase [Candidatus Caenarcaniphilales bacterium]|jgi:dephospho-CoA kinase|nr:dephospho-CoA kinase [Candidatus Caenarcaniphilales bacterium]
MTLVIGLTGNIACGKSSAGKILGEMNIPILDSDAVVHQLYASNKQVQAKILEHFATLDRKKISQEIFGESVNAKEKRKILESIIHPAVDREFRNWIRENQQSPIIVNLVPLLFEANLQSRYDFIVVIKTKEELQRKRLKERNPDLSDEEIDNRIKSQMSQEKKAGMADFIIENNGPIDDLEIQIEELLDRLVA